MLTRWFAFPLGLIWTFKNKKSAIHVARLTIHEAGVRNCSDFSDKLVKDWRWQKRWAAPAQVWTAWGWQGISGAWGGAQKQPVIIFVTGYEKYVYDAFDAGAFQYLVKPVDEQKFAEVFGRAARQVLFEAEQRKKTCDPVWRRGKSHTAE